MLQKLIKTIYLSLISILITGQIKAQDYSDYTKCAEQDSLALVAFYYATGGPNWITELYDGDEYPLDLLGDDVAVYYQTDYPNAGRGKWLTGPVKDWFGVLLEKQQVGSSSDSVWRVVHLHPTDNRRSAGDIGLTGYVPREVGLLTALKWFKVNGNSGLKNTEIPDELYHSTLTVFDIEAAYFGGIISDEFRNCSNLQYINMRYSYLDTLPVLDFISDEKLQSAFVGTGSLIWLYDNHFSYATLMPLVEHLMSVNEDIGYEARYQNLVGREKEVILTSGSSVTLTSNDAGDGGTYSWDTNGMAMNIATQNYTVSEPGIYKAVVYNAYVAEHGADDPAAYDTKTYTKNINVVYEPEAPECDSIWTSYSGKEITVEFSKPMGVPTVSQVSDCTILSDGTYYSVESIERTGRLNNRYVFTLASPLSVGSTVEVSYSNGSIVCANGGALASFDKTALNCTREKPTLVSATTSTSGESIILTFDKYIDEDTFDPSDFTISGSDDNYVSEIVIKSGELDSKISKKIELITAEYLNVGDIITVSYNQGSLCGLYGGMLDSFSDFSVENVVNAVRIDVAITVIDGTENLKQVVVGGDIKSKSFKLYDNGTNGDAEANDHTWTKSFSLAPGTYTWEVYERTNAYDTIVSNDTIYLIVNDENSIDDLISSNTELSFIVDSITGITGETVFEYYNSTVTFILDMGDYLTQNTDVTAEPYLMGIDEDWVTGIGMEVYGDSSSNQFITQITKQNPGNELEFVFKNGDVWETATADTRTHTITGNDTINCIFEVIENSINIAEADNQPVLFPNPASDYVQIKLNSDATVLKVDIINLSGQIIKSCNNTETISIDNLNRGIYLIKITDSLNNNFYKEFLKL